MHALSFAIRGQLDSDGILREALETGDSPCNDEMPSKGQSKTNLLYSFAARRFIDCIVQPYCIDSLRCNK